MGKIVIFGAGEYYKFKKQQLLLKNQVVAIIDNKVEKTKLSDDSINIYNPKYIHTINYDCIYMMAPKKYIYDMLEQLLELGVKENEIKFGFNICPAFDANEELLLSTYGRMYVKNKKLFISFRQKEVLINNQKELDLFFVEEQRYYDKYIQYIADMDLKPLSYRFGAERGKPIDRYYIEKFLEDNSKYIQGDVAEIAENTYTIKYGINVKNSYIYHVEGLNGAKKVNLETGDGVVDGALDCLILTQTLQTIYDLSITMKNIKRLLKKDGTALITLPGITQISLRDYNNWGDRWRFNDIVARELAINAGFEPEKIEVQSHGNIKTCFALLYGLCLEDMKEEDFKYIDKQYQMLITMRITK